LQILDVYPCNQFEYAEEAGGLKYMRALGAGESSLWRSDGTPAGTGLVRDINPGGNDAVGRIAPAGSSVFFSANDGVHGRELWTSDGSDVGTRMVFDAYEGRASGMPDNGHSVVAVNNRLYFQARGPVPAGGGSGERLWVINLREADFDNSGDVGVEDVFSFLRSYFLGEDLADTDVDGSITVEDVYAWLGSCFSDVAE
jgi:ELWxxDGT repeat protein